MKNLKLILISLIVSASITSCAEKTPQKSVDEQLSFCATNNQTVILVAGSDKTSTEKLVAMADKVAAKNNTVAIVELNVDDKANAAVVEKFGLSEAPMPLILLISGSGTTLGGMLEEQVTIQTLTDAIPTPQYSKIIAALGQGRPVIAAISSNGFKSDKAAIALCEAAKNEMQGAADIVRVDVNDAKEQKLIEMLNIKGQLIDTYIVVLNGQGIMSGRFETLPSQQELIEAAKTETQNGCAPGGCGPTCD